MFTDRDKRLQEFHSRSSNEYYAPFQKFNNRTRVNIGAYFASPMFNSADPDDDLSVSRSSQLDVENSLISSLKAISSEFTNRAAENKLGGEVSFNFLPLIPRQFELMGYATENKVVENDLRAIDSCKVFILNHCEGPSVGTSMETFYAKRIAQIPVITVVKPDQNISIWMRYHTDYFIHSDHIEEGLPRIINNEFGHLV